MLDYFRKGFLLVNKTWPVIVVGFFAYFLGFISPQLRVLGMLSWIGIFISWVFNLSIPRFYLDALERNLTRESFIATFMNNAKRLVIPGIVLFILMIFGLMFLLAILVMTLGPGQFDKESLVIFFSQFSPGNQYSLPLGIISLFLATVASGLFLFLPIYFSVEKIGFFRSLWQGILFVKKNLLFSFSAALIYFVFYELIGIFLSPLMLLNQQLLYSFINGFVNVYIGLIISAGSLIYYQDRKAKTPYDSPSFNI